MSALPLLQLMSRKGCCLCEDAEAAARQLEARGACHLEVVDVDRDLELALRYGADVPVLLVDGEEKMKHHIGAGELAALLSTGEVRQDV